MDVQRQGSEVPGRVVGERVDQRRTDSLTALFGHDCHDQLRERFAVLVAQQRRLVKVPPSSAHGPTVVTRGDHGGVRPGQ